MGKVTKLHGLAVWAFEKCMEIEKATGAEVFVEYSSHVGKIGVRVFVNSWKACKKPNYEFEIKAEESEYYDCDSCLEEMCWFEDAVYEIERVRFELECEKRRQTKQDKLKQIAKLQKELEDMDND